MIRLALLGVALGLILSLANDYLHPYTKTEKIVYAECRK